MSEIYLRGQGVDGEAQSPLSSRRVIGKGGVDVQGAVLQTIRQTNVAVKVGRWEFSAGSTRLPEPGPRSAGLFFSHFSVIGLRARRWVVNLMRVK